MYGEENEMTRMTVYQGRCFSEFTILIKNLAVDILARF